MYYLLKANDPTASSGQSQSSQDPSLFIQSVDACTMTNLDSHVDQSTETWPQPPNMQPDPLPPNSFSLGSQSYRLLFSEFQNIISRLTRSSLNSDLNSSVQSLVSFHFRLLGSVRNILSQTELIELRHLQNRKLLCSMMKSQI